MSKTPELTEKQKEGLKIGVERFKNKEKYTTIAGYAGTGKTFITKKIIDSIGLREDEYLVGAFTGKASQKLIESGFLNAQTLHKIIYNTVKTPKGFIHKKKSKNEFKGIKLILIDEVSMVSNNLLSDIADLGIHVIMLGDPGQLPPVGADNGMLSKPHIFLDEIMRQEEGNSILKLASDIREGKKIKPFCDEFVKIIPREELDIESLLTASQVICGRNATRRYLNTSIRKEKGLLEGMPVKGDKIIVTNNNWDILNESSMPLINGLMGTCFHTTGIFKQDERNGRAMGKTIKLARMTLTPDFGGGDYTFKYDALPLLKGENEYSYIINQFAKGENRVNYIDYGYAITCHKSQGSEYDTVVGIEEVLNVSQHRKWLYTLVTRAKEKLILTYDKNSDIWDL